VCCSKGTLRDRRPKRNPDGSCASYSVQQGDYCAKIAASNGLKVSDIETFNKQTWGWSGCENLFPDSKLCVSAGTPPMPAPISNAVCGPQKPNTPKVTDTRRSALAELNGCPLNVCCNFWGQCGTTPLFCDITGDGTPGHVNPGTAGCISNCGQKIVNNGVGPKSYRNIAYFEAWNGDRPCLYMDVTDVDKSHYSHIHFSFLDLTETFGVSTANVQDQYDKLLDMDGINRVAAFGGWAASTQPSTYWIFREGVKPANREKLASNIAAFISLHGLEGVDIDWEYPGAQDMIGIPAADPLEGENYLEFLKLLRRKLPNKSISIAAPASYWYLRGFPIKKMAEQVGYIVYMTYDLHAQWDYGSSWTQEGCPTGDCLRSHVNATETYNALVMITKAGVESHKIQVGVSSYGRSFRQVEAGCIGPMCKYVGSDSAAEPGRCTNTRGYVSNAEMNEIMVKNSGARWFRDEESDSDILVYNDYEWVAYMNDENKLRRTNYYKSLNFGGVSDWAVDL
ncbi:glycoside hydrolase, partial [Decorospora gaudefroyi]